MSANDYHIIVYQVLAYLYECLKDGIEVSLPAVEKFKADACINDKYWQYILLNLQKEGYVSGLDDVPILGTYEKQLKVTPAFAITPKGIE